jgi:hypothetical protein
MKTPTLEEVKQKYSNAKEVRCLADKNIYNVSNFFLSYETDKEEVFFVFKENERIKVNAENISKYCVIWDKDNDFAEIISYKSNPNIDLSKLTTDHIIELCKDENIKEFMINNGVLKNELEVGKWYKIKNKNILFIKLESGFYGFLNGVEKKLNWEWVYNSYYELATPQEVETALKNEAVKNYKMGDKIEPIENLYYGGSKMIIDNLNFKYNFEDNLLFVEDEKGYAVFVFNKGVWAEIIKEETYIKIPLSVITLTESDKKLGRLVRTIAENY